MSIDFSEDARGVQLRLLISRAQYERYVANKAASILAETFNAVADAIVSPSFRDLSTFQQQRTLQLFAEVKTRLAAGYQTLSTSMVQELSGYSGLESAIAKAQIASAIDTGGSALSASLGAFLPNVLTNSIASLAVQGSTIPTWFTDQLSGISVSTISAIQQGLVQGMSVRQISANIMGASQATDPLNQTANVLARAKRDATAITRTSVTAVHNDAAQQSYKDAGPQITQSYRWASVRDNRTTPICRALDGQVFRYDDPSRRIPPAHFSCRSAIIPITDGTLAKKLGLDNSGPEHSMQSYNDWLKTQSNAEQNTILGPSRASMWRSGSLTLANAIDQDGRTLTLAQMRDAVAPVAVSAP